MKSICIALLALTLTACSNGGSYTPEQHHGPAPQAPPSENPGNGKNGSDSNGNLNNDIPVESCTQGSTEVHLAGKWLTRLADSNESDIWTLTFDDNSGFDLTSDCTFYDHTSDHVSLSITYTVPEQGTIAVVQGGSAMSAKTGHACILSWVTGIQVNYHFNGSCLVVSDGARELFFVRHL
jgi:hypothetical protein